MKKYVLEALGTFFLLLIGFASGVLGYNYFDLYGVAAAFALTFCFWYYIMGKFSVCHLNPVVTFGAFILNKIQAKECFAYILAQFIGAVVASLVLMLYISLSVDAVKAFTVASYWANTFAEYSVLHISVWAAIVVEVILTGVFVFVFLVMYYKYDKPKLTGAIIAGVYFVIIVCGFNLTGACVNPARAFGPAFVYMLSGEFAIMIEFIPLLIATVIGSFVAIIAFRLMFKEQCKDARLFKYKG